jgi:predicted GNAT family acetyltransferase
MDTTVRHNASGARNEICIDGRVVGFADYRIAGDTVEFPHTEITPLLRGCWYVAEYLREHPEYEHLRAS